MPANQDGSETREMGARMRGIDVQRRVAILWVVLFHLWGDIKFFPPVPRDYYTRFLDHVRDGAPLWHIVTAVTDIMLRDGFEGVPLFMMLSGASLTISAYRAGGDVSWPLFFWRRFRKLLLPYAAVVLLTYGVIVLIAWRQTQVSGGGFSAQFADGVTISRYTHLHIDGGVMLASFTLVPRLLWDKWFFAPQLALWFVGLIAQYYLLFPLLFVLMRRIGLVPFLALTFALTVGANAWALWQYRILELHFRLVTGWAPFRLFEFTAGMAAGAIIADPARRRVLDALRRPGAIAAMLFAGMAAHTYGDLMIGQWNLGYWQAFALPLMTMGLGLLALPLMTKRPSGADGWLPVRALAFVGVLSYALLIVNDPMRLVASQLRVEQVPAAIWWTFTVAVYVPLSVLLAWPLAHLLGLMPERPKDAPRRQPVAVERSDEAYAGAPAG